MLIKPISIKEKCFIFDLKQKGFLGVFHITDILFCVWSNNFYKLIPSLIWFHVCNKEKVVDAILYNCIPLKLFVPQISSFSNMSFEWILKSVIRNFRNYSKVSYGGNTNLLLVCSFKEEFLRNTYNRSIFQRDSQSRWFPSWYLALISSKSKFRLLENTAEANYANEKYRSTLANK